jgi:hypothetical protein
MVNLEVTNEFEQRFSTAVSVQRWADIPLAGMHIFDRDVLGTDFAQTEVKPTQGPGIIVVALTDRATDSGDTVGGSIAAVPHAVGVHADQDRISLTSE